MAPKPLILTDASLKLGTTPTDTYATLKELACNVSHLELSPDTNVTTIDTMCGSKDYPGTVKWSLVATLIQTFDTNETEDVLSQALAASRAAGGAAIPFAVQGYKSLPVGADNPVWTGMVIPQDYAPINGDAGDASEVEIEWGLDAPPTKNETTPTAASFAGEEATTSSKKAA